MDNKIKIRTAEEKDIPELLDIYNQEVLYGTASFDTIPKTLDERREWFFAHNVANHPLIVAERGGKLAGYASLSPYRDKEAYKGTVELSVYVGETHRRMGVASALMKALLDSARQDASTHTVVSIITEENRASIALHEKFGFSRCGIIHRAGIKFGRFLNTVFFEMSV